MIVNNSKRAVFVVMDNGRASNMLQDLKKQGVSGGTILKAQGTADDDLLHLLAINHIEREILLMAMDDEAEKKVYDRLLDVYELDRPNSGIAFTIPINEVYGIQSLSNTNEQRSELTVEYEAIFVISENHEGDEVVDIAREHGAKGGTIIHGRGAGTTDTESIFNLVIEPEKEIVMLLVKKEHTQSIIEGINKDLNLSEPGHGIIFSMPVTHSIGVA